MIDFPVDQSLLMPNKLNATIKQGADIYSTILNMFAAPEVMKTQRELAQEQLKQAQMKNQIAPLMDQESLTHAKLANQYYPLTQLLDAQRAQNQADSIQQSRNRFGTAYLFSKDFANLPPPEKKQYFADHPGAYETLLAAQGNQALKEALVSQDQTNNSSNQYSTAINKKLMDLGLLSKGSNIPQLNSAPNTLSNPQTANQSNLPLSPDQIAKLISLQNSGQQTTLLGQSGNQPIPLQTVQPTANPNIPYSGTTDFTPSNQQVNSAQYSAKYDTNKSLNTAQLNSRIDAGEALSNLFEQPHVLKNLTTLTQYSGAEGRAKLLWARMFHPNEYLQYQNAADQLGTILSGSLKGIESLPTSNEGMRTGKDFINKAALLSTAKGDPGAVANYLIRGIDLITDEQNALLKTGQKAYPDLIPPHKRVSSMLDEIAQGKKPEDVLTINKNLRTGATTVGVEKSTNQYQTKVVNGKYFVQDPDTKKWIAEDDL